MHKTAAALDISLDHLKEEEVEAILKVLERDAQIQKREETRRQTLRESVKYERIPGKRLSVKLRTGDWMSEISTPSRQKERATEIIRASIRRKNEQSENGQLHPTKPDVVVDADKLDVQKSPTRKTSIRRKHSPKPQGKQVTFNDDKTEKIIYNQPTCTTQKTDEPTLLEKAKVKDASRQSYEKPVEVTVIEDRISQDEKQYDSQVFSSSSTFENYHNSFALGVQKPEESQEPQQEDKSDKERSSKKVRVVKRVGSSRRKVKSKLTDDSDRDSLFRAPSNNDVKADVESVAPKLASVEHTAANEAEDLHQSVTTVNDVQKAPNSYSHEKDLATKSTLEHATDESTLPADGDVQTGEMMKADVVMEEVFKEITEVVECARAVPIETYSLISDEIGVQPHIKETKTSESQPQDTHQNENTDSLGQLVASQDYADVTLKPYDFKQALSPSNESKGVDIDVDGNGGRTPTKDQPEGLDGMELLKEIEAAFPAVTKDSEGQTLPFTTGDSTEIQTEPMNIHSEQKAESHDPSAIEVGDSEKPKRKVIKKIKKPKHDKEDDTKDAPDVDEQARTLLDEVAKSLMDTDNKSQEQSAESLEHGRKKVVKKVMRKKKAEEPASEDRQEPDNVSLDHGVGDEFRLSRRKTVKKKVVRRPPPPPEQ